MQSYGTLEPGKYYLIQEKEGSGLVLLYILMATDKAVLADYVDSARERLWLRKTDTFHELVEILSDEHASLYQMLTSEEGEPGTDHWPDTDETEDFDAFWTRQQDDPDLPYKN
jgi:hypothetical protein